MPRVITYRGKLSLTGTTRDSQSAELYRVDKYVYGETPGALLDNMVDESIIIAQNLKTFLRLEMPAGYKMSNDYWFFSFSHPNITENDYVGDDQDTGSGTSISSVKEVVVSAAHNRHLSIQFGIKALNRTRRDMGLTALLPKNSDNAVNFSSTKFDVIVASGYQGTELDNAIAIAENDGSLTKYRSDMVVIRQHREFERKKRVRNAETQEFVKNIKNKIASFFMDKS